MTSSQATGQLIIAGCGLHPGHMTLETQKHIEQAEIVMVRQGRECKEMWSKASGGRGKRTEQSRAKQSRTEKNRAEQSRVLQDRID